MFKVRFHLGRGAHYMQWQVSSDDGVAYYDPDDVVLRMRGCRLRNQAGTARKIFEGDDKTVCAWVDCDSVEVERTAADVDCWQRGGRQLSYNPRIAPYWRSSSGADIDGGEFGEVVSVGRQLYSVGV